MGGYPLSSFTLAAGLGLAIGTSACLAYAGEVTRRRPLQGSDRLAGTAFAVWWYSASLVILNQAARTLFALFGVEGSSVYEAQSTFGMIPLAAAVWGLSYYMLYLLTGRSSWFGPVTVFYGAYLVYLFWFSVRQGIESVYIGEWAALVETRTPPTTAMNLIFGIWLAAPVLFAVGAYFLLALGERDPTRRYRLCLISGGFILLFSIVLAGYLLGWATQPWFVLAYQIPALLASILAVAAYRPPRWVQRRWGITPVPGGPLRNA